MDGARRQGSLRVSSSVAEGVLTPAALHLRVSAEVERMRGGGGVMVMVVVNGPRCHRLHFSHGDRKPSSTAMPTYIFTATKYYPGAMVKCAGMEAQLRVHPADSACEQ